MIVQRYYKEIREKNICPNENTLGYQQFSQQNPKLHSSTHQVLQQSVRSHICKTTPSPIRKKITCFPYNNN